MIGDIRGYVLIRSLPPPGIRGSKQRVDHRHVLHRVLQRVGRGRAVADGSREQIALQAVLVARLELDPLGPGAGQIGPVVDEQATGAIGRRVERDLDLDPARAPRILTR